MCIYVKRIERIVIFFGFDIFSWDVVTDCYQRDKKEDDDFHNAAMKNPMIVMLKDI